MQIQSSTVKKHIPFEKALGLDMKRETVAQEFVGHRKFHPHNHAYYYQIDRIWLSCAVETDLSKVLGEAVYIRAIDGSIFYRMIEAHEDGLKIAKFYETRGYTDDNCYTSGVLYHAE